MTRTMEKDAQFTVRLPQELKDAMQKAAKEEDIDMVSWLRHAIREKLLHDSGEKLFSKSEIKDAIIELKKEGLI